MTRQSLIRKACLETGLRVSFRALLLPRVVPTSAGGPGASLSSSNQRRMDWDPRKQRFPSLSHPHSGTFQKEGRAGGRSKPWCSGSEEARSRLSLQLNRALRGSVPPGQKFLGSPEAYPWEAPAQPPRALSPPPAPAEFPPPSSSTFSSSSCL